MVAFSVGYFTSEFEARVPSILLLATSSLVVVNRFSAVVALVTSLFKLEVIIASPLVRSVASVLRLLVKTPSALVALLTSAVSAVEFPVAAAST